MPSFHEAHAVGKRGEIEQLDGDHKKTIPHVLPKMEQSVNSVGGETIQEESAPSFTPPVINAAHEEALQEESDHPFTSSVSSALSYARNAALYLGSTLWDSGVVLPILATLAEPYVDFYTALACIGGIQLVDEISSHQVSRALDSAKENLPYLIGKTVKGATIACKSFAPTKASGLLNTYLLFSSLLPFANGALSQSITVNGGENLELAYDRHSSPTYYNYETAPFLIGLAPNQSLLTFLEYNPRYQDSFYFMTPFQRGDHCDNPDHCWISILSTVENLKNILGKASFGHPLDIRFGNPLDNVPEYDHIFKFYANVSATINDAPLITATRHFVDKDVAAYRWTGKTLGVTLGSLFSLAILGLCANVAYNCCKKPTNESPDDELTADDELAEILINEDNVPDYNILTKALEKITDPASRQDHAWAMIQRLKESLNYRSLFYLCSEIKKGHPSYDEVLPIQVGCLRAGLQGEDKDSDDFITNFLNDLVSFNRISLNIGLTKTENLERYLNIAWTSIQQNRENSQSKQSDVLLHLCAFFEKADPLYPEALALLAKSIIETVQQETDEETSEGTILKQIDQELAKMTDSTRQQDLTWKLIQELTKLNTSLSSRLCERIQKNHPQYVDAKYQQASFILGNETLSLNDRYNQAMGSLIHISGDRDAKDLMAQLVRNRYLDNDISGEVPSELQNFAPQTDRELTLLKLLIKQKEEQKKEQKELAA